MENPRKRSTINIARIILVVLLLVVEFISLLIFAESLRDETANPILIVAALVCIAALLSSVLIVKGYLRDRHKALRMQISGLSAAPAKPPAISPESETGAANPGSTEKGPVREEFSAEARRPHVEAEPDTAGLAGDARRIERSAATETERTNPGSSRLTKEAKVRLGDEFEAIEEELLDLVANAGAPQQEGLGIFRAEASAGPTPNNEADKKLKQEYESLKAAFDKLTAYAHSLEQEHDKIYEENSAIRQTLEEMHDAEDRLKSDSEYPKQALESITANTKSLERERDQIYAENAELRQELALLKASEAKLRSEHESVLQALERSNGAENRKKLEAYEKMKYFLENLVKHADRFFTPAVTKDHLHKVATFLDQLPR